MRTRESIAAAAVMTLAFSSMSSAGDAAMPLRSGDRLRYRMNQGDPLITGRVIEVLKSSLLVEADDGHGTLRLDEEQLAQLDVARGKRSHGRLGAILGGSAGAAFGGFFGFVAASLDEIESSHPAEGVLLGAAIVGGAGALVGLAIGSVIKTERWERLRDHKVQLVLAPVPGRGFAGAISVRF